MNTGIRNLQQFFHRVLIIVVGFRLIQIVVQARKRYPHALVTTMDQQVKDYPNSKHVALHTETYKQKFCQAAAAIQALPVVISVIFIGGYKA